QNAMNIAWQLDTLLMKNNHTLTTKLRQEEAKLENDILASASLLRPPNRATFVITCEQDDGTTGLPGVSLELFDGGSASVRLLMQNDGLAQQQLREEPSDSDLGFAVVAVHDENLSTEGSPRCGGGRER